MSTFQNEKERSVSGAECSEVPKVLGERVSPTQLTRCLGSVESSASGVWGGAWMTTF